MPHGRKKVPFSGKKKKTQLLAKRQTKLSNNHFLLKKSYGNDSDSEDNETGLLTDNVQKLNVQPARGRNNNPNRYVLQFHKETEKELRDKKIEARSILKSIPENEMELDDNYFFEFDFPIRPPWEYGMTKETLNGNENRYFTQYIQKLEAKHLQQNKHLSYCELNLETWRQLWRVLEISDIILMIVDIRYPTLMFPPSLYDYVTDKIGKKMILVLNKIDLAPASIVLAWKKYFEKKYEKICVVMFTSFPSYNLRKNQGNQGNQGNLESMQIRRRRGKMKMAAEGAQQILESCKLIVNDAVDLTSWEQKILEEMNMDNIDLNEDDDNLIITDGKHDDENEFDFKEHILYKNGTLLTVGCVGFPNVGKSSLLNALMGRKVVSVSRTPGHTKHFQTIFLTQNVRLCDCPGLVFPSAAPRNIQVLMGSFPIAQLKEPYGSIKYLAERQKLQNILNIQHPDGNNDKAAEWSAIDICDGWALKRGFLTAKAGRPDTYRAANNILRMALEGKLTICLRPVGFLQEKGIWENHPGLQEVEMIQALGKDETETTEQNEFVSSDEEEIEEEDLEVASIAPLTSNAFALLNDNDSDD